MGQTTGTQVTLSPGSEQITAEGHFAACLKVAEVATQAVMDVAGNSDLTREARERKTYDLQLAAVAKEEALTAEYLAKLDKWEAEAAKRAKTPATQLTEVFQLGRQNGLLMLQIMGRTATADDLAAELEAVVERGIPGEVSAWAEALPGVLREKVAQEGVAGRTRFAVPEIEARCRALKDSLKTDLQRRGEADLAFAREQRRRVQSIHNLNTASGPNLRQRLGRLRQAAGVASTQDGTMSSWLRAVGR